MRGDVCLNGMFNPSPDSNPNPSPNPHPNLCCAIEDTDLLCCVGSFDRVKRGGGKMDDGDRRMAALYADKGKWQGLQSNYKVKAIYHIHS